jgi:hypothetical protein
MPVDTRIFVASTLTLLITTVVFLILYLTSDGYKHKHNLAATLKRDKNIIIHDLPPGEKFQGYVTCNPDTLRVDFDVSCAAK